MEVCMRYTLDGRIRRTVGYGVVLMMSCMIGCSDPSTQEPEAARAMSLARDIEGDVDRLDEAIKAYQEIEEKHGDTPSGSRAAVRATELSSIADMIDGFQTAHEDSLPSVAGAILRKAPNYEPVLYRLGNHYANRSKLYARAASTWKNEHMAERLTRVWNFQDSLWSAYPFRPTHEDRGMRDVLCGHAVGMARMMQGQKRWKEAEALITRGLEYGNGKDILSEASVYGAFYKFRNGDSAGAHEMAGEALENDDLEEKLKAQAHHVRGLVMTYRYQDHKEVADLDQAIESLNQAVGLDPGLGDARTLLRELRKTRGKLQTS
jgi:tetratricopeptide (TPR) repeat protein